MVLKELNWPNVIHDNNYTSCIRPLPARARHSLELLLWDRPNERTNRAKCRGDIRVGRILLPSTWRPRLEVTTRWTLSLLVVNQSKLIACNTQRRVERLYLVLLRARNVTNGTDNFSRCWISRFVFANLLTILIDVNKREKKCQRMKARGDMRRENTVVTPRTQSNQAAAIFLKSRH